MTKKILTLALFSITLGFYFCSSDDNGTSDPTKTSEEFADPTGTLSSSNATTICNAGIVGSSAALFNDPEGIFELQADVNQSNALTASAECKTKSGDSTTIEWDCVFTNDTACEGSGTTVATDDAGKDFLSVEYNGFGVECTTGDGSVSIGCEGEINYARSDEFIYCANMDCELNGEAKKFDGCRNSDGYILVRTGGETFVVRQIDANDACTEVTFTIRDKSATTDVVCQILEYDGECDSASKIEKIRDCQIQQLIFLQLKKRGVTSALFLCDSKGTKRLNDGDGQYVRN